MTAYRLKEVRHAIIQTLERAKPYMLTTEHVRTTINFTLRPRATLAEFEEILEVMQTARQVTLHPTDDRETKIKLTDEGLAALNE